MDENRGGEMKDRLKAYVIISRCFFSPPSLPQEEGLIVGKLQQAS